MKTGIFTRTVNVGRPILLVDLILRIIQFVFAVIALGLSGKAADWIGDNYSRTSFAVFASVFALLFGAIFGILIYFISFLSHPAIIVVLDALNLIFTFASAVALADAVSGSCDVYYLHYYYSYKHFCQTSKAAAAFLFLLFFTFIASVAISIHRLISGFSKNREAPLDTERGVTDEEKVVGPDPAHNATPVAVVPSTPEPVYSNAKETTH